MYALASTSRSTCSPVNWPSAAPLFLHREPPFHTHGPQTFSPPRSTSLPFDRLVSHWLFHVISGLHLQKVVLPPFRIDLRASRLLDSAADLSADRLSMAFFVSSTVFCLPDSNFPLRRCDEDVECRREGGGSDGGSDGGGLDGGLGNQISLDLQMNT
ncbi:hypothetical protein Q7P37_002425 [Cladosporium fusiforme]